MTDTKNSGEAFAKALDATIARSSDAVKAACGMSTTSGADVLAECFSCGGTVERDDRREYESYSARESQSCGMGVSAGGFTRTTYAIQCECGVRFEGNNPHYLVARWNRRDPVAALIEREAALVARNADLEAELDAALRRANRADARVKGWESTLVVQNLPRRICPVEGWGPGEGETVDIPAITPEKLTEILDRADALAAEVKALRGDAERFTWQVAEWCRPQVTANMAIIEAYRTGDIDIIRAAIDAARASAATGGV